MKKQVKKAITAVTVTICLLGAFGVAESAKERKGNIKEAYEALGATYQMVEPCDAWQAYYH